MNLQFIKQIKRFGLKCYLIVVRGAVTVLQAIKNGKSVKPLGFIRGYIIDVSNGG